MAGKISSNQVNENVLKQCHEIYIKPETGLVTLAENIDKNLQLLVPRKKISILLIGNHSAGKSSFINWYLDEHIQKTGVAIETQGFTIVTSGKKRESLTGNATLHLYPHFKTLVNKVPSVLDHLTTEVSTSKSKKFPLVNLIDSPGLVDGEMKYPFNINESILWWASCVDLIFVFFDPIGQALCKRTLDICEQMADQGYREKMRFYLSKADEAGHEADRQRVMMQVVQELCKRPSLNTHSFDMPTIYVPTLNSNRSKCVNQIDLVCTEIEQTINLTIQNTLNQLQVDSVVLSRSLERNLDRDDDLKHQNTNKFLRKVFFYSIAFWPVIFLLGWCLLFLIDLFFDAEFFLTQNLGPNITRMIHATFLGENFVTSLTLNQKIYVGIFSFISYLLGKYTTKPHKILSKREKLLLMKYRSLLKDKIIKQKEHLYEEYLQQSISTGEL